MKRVDLAIVGGGIHGAGIAQAAAAAGHSVVVLERKALAAGTSSRSSKLIHGGLRYLESGQFHLVRECLHERALLLQLAPELVHLVPFFIPVYRETSRRPWQIRAGLSLYAALGGFDRDALFQQIPRAQWNRLDGLRTDGLLRLYRYFDGQTDDAALTRAVMASARELGAELRMPARFEGARIEGGGCRIRFRQGEREEEIEARLLVNAAGPWANRVLERVEPEVAPLAVDLVQGTHIVIDGTLEHGIYYVEAPQDRRAVFAIPWKGRLMVGTTETPFEGDPAAVAPRREEIDYLLAVLGHYFPRYRDLERGQVVEAFAGLRVLPRAPGSAFSRPRETIFHFDDPKNPKVATIYGGKLTAYRHTAEKFIRHIAPALPRRKARADTRRLPLTPA